MKIGIIGYGIVGQAAANTFCKAYDITKYDKFKDLDRFNSLLKCDFVFIMVPTPFDCQKNEVDDSAILENLSILDRENYKGIVIIKSTIPPGSIDKYSIRYGLNLVFNPEFLRESTSPNEDFENQDTVVIGTHSRDAFAEVRYIYEEVLSNQEKYFFVSPIEAEMIKYSQNTMLASRVALANMISDACIEIEVNYDLIKEIGFDRFDILGPNMSQVPGPDGKRGFGGKCLPKDTLGFNSIFESELLTAIINYNGLIRDDLNQVLKNYEDNE